MIVMLTIAQLVREQPPKEGLLYAGEEAEGVALGAPLGAWPLLPCALLLPPVVSTVLQVK